VCHVSLNKKIVIKVKHSFELCMSIGYGYNANFRFFIMSSHNIPQVEQFSF
jgi:hypothetical protein